MRAAFIDKVVSAIENKEIRAFYQPQYDANSGRLVSAEALVRWVKADGTVVSPDSFIPRLETSQDINILDWFMAEEACKTILELGDYAVPIGVNFSRWHVKEPDFARKLQSLLAAYGVPPKMLEVEITESALSNASFEEVEKWAYEVADIGINIAIDDFGSGFTSLQFVKDMPVTYLKIDKSFLRDNCQDDRGRGTLETVFYFAQRLGLKTIAEGVETMEQLKFMQSMDCNKIQGYLFSHPLKKEDFLVIAMMDEMPFKADDNEYVRRQGTLNSHSLLLKTIKKEYQLIIFGNLYKNSYYVMSEDLREGFNAYTAGVIDDMTDASIELCLPEDKKIYRDNLSRKALIEAYNNGKSRVECTIRQRTEEGMIETYHTVIYLYPHTNQDDIVMVGLTKIVNSVKEKVLEGALISRSENSINTNKTCN